MEHRAARQVELVRGEGTFAGEATCINIMSQHIALALARQKRRLEGAVERALLFAFTVDLGTCHGTRLHGKQRHWVRKEKRVVYVQGTLQLMCYRRSLSPRAGLSTITRDRSSCCACLSISPRREARCVKPETPTQVQI